MIGAGQAGLALGFHVRRLNQRADSPVSFVVLDDRSTPGGAWDDMWDTLSLFSPAGLSSLAGWPMPRWPHDGTPSARHVADYLTAYEDRYDLPVRRPHRVVDVRDTGDGWLLVTADDGATWRARVVVNATGSWVRPFWPSVPGAGSFAGRQLHAADYRTAADHDGERVLVVGGGNSGAQVAADLVLHGEAQVVWATREPPRFLPDDVDGRVLFEVATRAVLGRSRGEDDAGVGGLGDVVVVPSVREARDRHGLSAVAMPDRLTVEGAAWDDGRAEPFDTVVWCTGFRPALRHLGPLGLDTEDGHPRVQPPAPGSAASVAVGDPRVFFLGYGDWCAPASATLIGVNRPARDTAAAVVARVAAAYEVVGRG